MRPIHAMRCLALAATALVATLPVLAKEKKPIDPNKKVCRSAMPTGSRMSKTTCHTNAEWGQIDATNASAAQDIQSQAAHTSAN